tara:strand:- start:2058 stop:2438 length:381 start_codon:yes stop_codon:yes gene_type:complete
MVTLQNMGNTLKSKFFSDFVQENFGAKIMKNKKFSSKRLVPLRISEIVETLETRSTSIFKVSVGEFKNWKRYWQESKHHPIRSILLFSTIHPVIAPSRSCIFLIPNLFTVYLKSPDSTVQPSLSVL